MNNQLLIKFKIDLNKEGYSILSNTTSKIIRYNTGLNCVCPNKHILKLSYNSFSNGKRCNICIAHNIINSKKPLDKMTIRELKKIAPLFNIPNYTSLTRYYLIQEIKKSDKYNIYFNYNNELKFHSSQSTLKL